MSADPIAYTHDGAAYCPADALTRFGRCADGDIGCNLHDMPADRADPERASSLKGDPGEGTDPGVVFGYDSESWTHGGLSCDDCGGELVENDDCPECERSLSEDHETYEFGPVGHTVRVGPLCPGRHGVASIIVRELVTPRIGTGRPVSRLRGVTPDAPAVHVETVPFDLPRAVIDGPPDPDLTAPWFAGASGTWQPAPVEDAWAAIVAAYSGHVATFDPAPFDPMYPEPYATVQG